jgi:hypothetical protein
VPQLEPQSDGPQRYFFIHVMKTAGTALARELKREFGHDAVYPQRGLDWQSANDIEAYVSVPRLRNLSAERRATVKVYTGHFPYMARDVIGPDVVAFTLLREPVDRTVSVLKHFKRIERYQDRPLEEIYEELQVYRFFIENHQTKVFSLVAEDNAPAINCAIVTDDVRYARALDNLAHVDVVGLTESYEEFIEELRAKFGWWRNGPDLRRDVNVSRESWDVRPEFRDRIAADNAYDVEFYARATELVAHRRARR